MSTAVARPSAYGRNDSRQPPSSVSSPPSGGNTASEMVRMAAFCPTSRARSSPVQWSPMSTTARLMSPAEPMPCSSRSGEQRREGRGQRRQQPEDAEGDQARHEHRPAPEPVGEHADHRRHDDAGQGARRHEEPGARVGLVERLEDVGDGRPDERVGEDPGDRDREDQRQRRGLDRGHLFPKRADGWTPPSACSDGRTRGAEMQWIDAHDVSRRTGRRSRCGGRGGRTARPTRRASRGRGRARRR